MNEPNQPAVPPVPVAMQLGKPGDKFIACLIPAGTDNLQILTGGELPESEFALMLVAALNVMLLKIHEGPAKEKSRLIDPFAAFRRRG